METFRTLFKLIIRHSFYPQKNGRFIQVRPDLTTQRTLHNHACVFRQVAPDEWAIAGKRETEETPDVSSLPPSIHFLLAITDPDFFYYTVPALPAISSKIAIRFRLLQQAYNQQEIICDTLVSEMKKTTDGPILCVLQYTAARRYWEYLLIPRVGKTENRQLFLSDTENIIPFGPATPVEWEGTQAYRVRTETPVELHAAYPGSIQLYEKKSFGTQSRGTVKKLLCKQVPPPAPAQLIGQTKDTIQRILYF